MGVYDVYEGKKKVSETTNIYDKIQDDETQFKKNVLIRLEKLEAKF